MSKTAIIVRNSPPQPVCIEPFVSNHFGAVWHDLYMPSVENDIRRILRQAGEPLWASDITERLNAEIGAGAYTVDEIATRLVKMGDVFTTPDGRWELERH